jgi:hypothetical protein
VTVGKGLLAQWRRGIFARGLAGAAMLAVPVAVAAMIGFGTSLSGVSEGLGALATGPPAAQTAERDRVARPPIDGAISAVATSTGDGGRSAAAPAPASPRGGDDGGTGTGGEPESPGAAPTVPIPGAGTGIGGGGGAQGPTEQPLPQVDVTTPNPGGGGLQGLLDDVGNAVDQLLGGRGG